MGVLGYVLSNATTTRAVAQLTAYGEERVVEGMLVGVEAREGLALARVDSVRFVSDAFREGDPWTELRRLGEVSIEGVERVVGRYALAELSILGLAGRELRELRVPPEPGSRIVELENDPRRVFGVEGRGIVWFGEVVGCEGLALPLSVEELTMHLGVFGETGSGKSYTVGYLIELLSEIELGDGERAALPTMVVDANGDYIDFHREFVSGRRVGEFHEVRRFVFECSRCSREPYTSPIKIDLDEFSSRELAELIAVYRYGSYEASELQIHLIERALTEVRELYSITHALSKRPDTVLEALEEVAKRLRPHPQTLRAARAALEKFIEDLVHRHRMVSESPTISGDLIDRITSSPSLVILDFSAEGAPGIPLILKQLVVGYVARLLYKKFTEYKIRGDERYLLFVIEEAQNYIPNTRLYPIGFSVARDPLALIATQGRKFGICLAIVSQRPSFVDPVVMSMINTWIIHRVPPEDANFVSRLVGGLPRSLESRLTRLRRGVCLVHGQMNVVGAPMLVHITRRRVEHRMGRTRLIEVLSRIYRDRTT